VFDFDMVLHDSGNGSLGSRGEFLGFPIIGEIDMVRMDHGILS
jgi:hypothetical protein